MKIHISEDLCSGHGRCYTLSPKIVQADDDGFPQQRGRDIDIRPADYRGRSAPDCRQLP